MRSSSTAIVVFVIILGLSRGVSEAASSSRSLDKPDLISGEWIGSFEVGGYSAEVTLKLKLEGAKVVGTANSEHTGPGTVTKGSWSENKVSFTVEFEAHDSIAVTGTLKDGKLTGEFRTEGMVGAWEAAKKK